MEKVAAVYRQYKRKGIPDAVPGFCKVATLDEVRQHNYALTPGRYVGAEDVEEGEPFEEKLPRLTATLRDQMKKAAELDAAMNDVLAEVSNGQ